MKKNCWLESGESSGNEFKLFGQPLAGFHRPGKVLEFDFGPGKLLEFEKKCLLSWNFVKSSLKI